MSDRTTEAIRAPPAAAPVPNVPAYDAPVRGAGGGRHGPLWALAAGAAEAADPVRAAALRQMQASAGNAAVAQAREAVRDGPTAAAPTLAPPGQPAAVMPPPAPVAPAQPTEMPKQPEVAAPAAETAKAPERHGPLWAAGDELPQTGELRAEPPAPAPAVAPTAAAAPAEAGDAGALSPQAVRARGAAGAAALRHAALPSPVQVRAPIDQERADIEARGAARATAAQVAPRELAGLPPGAGEPERKDPGPIPAAMKALQDASGQKLKPAALPDVKTRPGGTRPDVTGPAFTEQQLRLVRIGDVAIDSLQSLRPEEREELKKLRAQLEQGQAATVPAPSPEPGAAPAPPPTSVAVVDEEVVGVAVTPGQRALLGQVVGELAGDIDNEAEQVLTTIRTTHALYPGGVLQTAAPTLGEAELKPLLLAAVREQSNLIAASLGMAEADIEAAVIARKKEVQARHKAASAAVNDASNAANASANVVLTRASGQAQASADAARKAASSDRRATGGRHKPTVQDRIQQTIAEITDQVTLEMARLDAQLRNRERALASAVSRQVAAYRLAQTRDEIALRQETYENQLKRRAARDWADTAELELTKALKDKTDEASAQTKELKDVLDKAGAAAFAELRKWAATQAKANDTWWTALDTGLDIWANDAGVRAAHWAGAKQQSARLALVQDVAAIQKLVDFQRQGNKQAAEEYESGLDAEARTVLVTQIQSAMAGAPDPVGALAAGIRERVRAANQQDIEHKLQAAVLALPDDESTLRGPILKLLNAAQPGWDVQQKANEIKEGLTLGVFHGTNEQRIFAALEGLSPLAAKALRIQYQFAYGMSLEYALRGGPNEGAPLRVAGYLNEDEMKAAKGLMEGEAVVGAAGALRSATTGWGTEREGIRRIWRNLTPQQREQTLALYQKHYGESFTEAINGEWGLSRAEKDEFGARAKGDDRGADAFALRETVQERSTPPNRGGGGGQRYITIDRDKAAAVYARIHAEVDAEGRAKRWTTQQVEAETTFRYQQTAQAFQEQNKDAWWAKEKGGTALQAAFSAASPAGREMLEAISKNDLAAADVARLKLEDQGVYADDAAINAVFRDQYSRSMEELDRDLGPVLSDNVDYQLDQEDKAGRFKTAEERFDRRKKLEHASAKQLAGLAATRTQARMDALEGNYQKSAHRTLSQMIDANMSGVDKEEAHARVAAHGVLTNYQRMKYAMEGRGSDKPEMRAVLGSMDKDERDAVDRQWRAEHDGETLEERVRDETSGRESGDLGYLARYGAPQTAQALVDQADERFTRDRGEDSATGAFLTANEIRVAKAELDDLKAQLKEMKRTGLSPEQQKLAGSRFEIAMDRTMGAIQIQRDRVDALTDSFATIAAIVASVVVGALLAPFTGGGSALVAAAIIASLVGTAALIGTKKLIKGGAYGRDEFKSDLIQGAIDAAVAALTAGVGNALLGKVGKAATAVEKSRMFQALNRLGKVGQFAARQQARVAGAFAKLGTRGPLARALEGKALLAGLVAEGKPAWMRLAGHGGALIAEHGLQALPGPYVGALLDPDAGRQPGGRAHALSGAWDGVTQNVAMSLGFSFAHSAMHGFPGVREIFRSRPPEPTIRSHDVLGHLGTPAERLADFRKWKAANPEGNYRDFYGAREAKVLEGMRATDAVRSQQRAARKAMLSGLEPHEARGYADVPIAPLPEAEFRKLAGSGAGADAHLLVREGQAVILVREGAPATAAKALLPQIRERVFAGAGGMTLEGALPPHLREQVPIRRGDPTVRGDTVRVVPIPREGPITGVEVVIGPTAQPIDVALHVGEINRQRRWMGRIGEARMALAAAGERLGLQIESPRDRTRFEAAGEVRKLGPIIEERMRRLAAAADNPRRAIEIEADIQHLIAQQEHARRILTGEIKTAPRGYVAAEARERPPPDEKAATEAPDVMARAQALDVEVAVLRNKHDTASRDSRAIEDAIRNEGQIIYNFARRGSRDPAVVRGLGEAAAFKEQFAERHYTGPPEELRAALQTADSKTAAKVQEHLDLIEKQRERLTTALKAEDKARARLEAKRAKLEALPDRAKAVARANRTLDYDAVQRGPDGVCFPPDTQVATPTGPIAIGTLRVGDTVLAGDPVTGAVAAVLVIKRIEGWTDWLVEIEAGGSSLRATRSHRVRRADRPEWMAARLVRPGMRLCVPGGEPVTVGQVRLVVGVFATCNLEVERTHTFIVGAARILAHNGDTEEDRAGGEPARNYESTKSRPAEIYYVSVRENGQWRLVYVGSTRRQGLSKARFEGSSGHISQGREADPKFRDDKKRWAELYDQGWQRRDVEVVTNEFGQKTYRYGDVRVEVVVHGEYTDLALAIVEQAHISKARAGNQLINKSAALGDDGFNKYYGELTPEQRAVHRPCR